MDLLACWFFTWAEKETIPKEFENYCCIWMRTSKIHSVCHNLENQMLDYDDNWCEDDQGLHRADEPRCLRKAGFTNQRLEGRTNRTLGFDIHEIGGIRMGKRPKGLSLLQCQSSAFMAGGRMSTWRIGAAIDFHSTQNPFHLLIWLLQRERRIMRLNRKAKKWS